MTLDSDFITLITKLPNSKSLRFIDVNFIRFCIN